MEQSHQILAALRKNQGNMTATARALGWSRQHLYNQIDLAPDLQEALDKIRARHDQQRDVTVGMIRVLKLDPDEVKLRALAAKVPERAAARALAVEALAQKTNRPKRDVVHTVASDPKLEEALAAKLPPVSDEKPVPKGIFPCSLTHDQAVWLREQGKGYVGKLLDELQTFPEVSQAERDGDVMAARQTSFYVADKARRRLLAEAKRQRVSPIVLFRAVVRGAMERARAQAA